MFLNCTFVQNLISYPTEWIEKEGVREQSYAEHVWSKGAERSKKIMEKLYPLLRSIILEAAAL
jgi:hypothetical protein